MVTSEKSRVMESKEQAIAHGMSEIAKQYDSQIEELDHRIEAETTLLKRKHYGLCAHAWIAMSKQPV